MAIHYVILGETRSVTLASTGSVRSQSRLKLSMGFDVPANVSYNAETYSDWCATALAQ